MQAPKEGKDVRDEIVPVLALLQSTERHLGPRNVLLGVLEVFELGNGQHIGFSDGGMSASIRASSRPT